MLKFYGGTIGKIMVNITVTKLDGSSIGWKEAFLRNIIGYILSFIASILLIQILLNHQEVFKFGNFMEFSKNLNFITKNNLNFLLMQTLVSIWTWGELFVLLLNKKRRALHDFIAGTVVISEENEIEEEEEEEEDYDDDENLES